VRRGAGGGDEASDEFTNGVFKGGDKTRLQRESDLALCHHWLRGARCAKKEKNKTAQGGARASVCGAYYYCVQNSGEGVFAGQKAVRSVELDIPFINTQMRRSARSTRANKHTHNSLRGMDKQKNRGGKRARAEKKSTQNENKERFRLERVS
jgi:hypothetical protein